MTEWRHECSLDWLKARQCFLTASDVHSLLPFTATGRKRKVDSSTYLKLLASKWKRLTQEDAISTGAAARGHMLEPEAVRAVNRIYPSVFKHWDDLLVYGNVRNLAYSPDAVDAEMPVPMTTELRVPGWPNEEVYVDSAVHCDSFTHTSILEVKCYSPERHLDTMFMDKDKVEERWQLATAMAVDPNIMQAWLVLHNPDMFKYGDAMFHWTRFELAEETGIVLDVCDAWNDFLDFDLWGKGRESMLFHCERTES